VAMGVSAAFGTGLGVLGGAVLVLGLIAISACLPMARRRTGVV